MRGIGQQAVDHIIGLILSLKEMEVREETGKHVGVFIHEIWEVDSMLLIKKPAYDTCGL